MRIAPTAFALAIAAACLAWTAEAVPMNYSATLSGAAEEPPNESPGTGSARVQIDTAAHTMLVRFIFSDLVGATTAAHIHGPTAMPLEGIAGVATAVPTFPGTPLGVTSGSYDQVFDLTDAASFNPAFIMNNGGTPASAEAALAAALAGGRAYLNIHTTFRSAGEIRGFLTPVPLPAALPLLLGGLILLAWTGRSRPGA